MPFSVTRAARTPARIAPGSPQAVAEGCRIELVTHVEHGHALLIAGPAVRADQLAGVGLHAEEVVTLGGVEEHVFCVVADALKFLLATRAQIW